MRIHTDTLTERDIHAATMAAGMVGVDAIVTRHGSRKRDHALNVYLTGTSSRKPNSSSGDYAHAGHAATRDEWGMFLAELFRRDPGMTIPRVYEHKTHFRWATDARYDKLTARFQHGKGGHRWKHLGASAGGAYTVSECQDCDAIRRYVYPENLALIFGDREA